MKKIIFLLLGFIFVISNVSVQAARPEKITDNTPSISTGNFGGTNLNRFGKINDQTIIYNGGPDLKNLATYLNNGYIFSSKLKTQINNIIDELAVITNTVKTSLIQSENTVSNQLENALTQVDEKTGDLEKRLIHIENLTLVDGFYTLNSDALQKTNDWVHLQFSTILENYNKVFSSYINKRAYPGIPGFRINFDVNINDSRIIVGRTYRVLVTGNDKFRLLLRHANLYQSPIQLFVQGGTEGTDYVINNSVSYTATNSVVTKPHVEYEYKTNTNKFNSYWIEITPAERHIFVSVKQSSYDIKVPQWTEDIRNIAVPSFIKENITALGSTPVLNGPRGSWGWVTAEDSTTAVGNRLALTIRTPANLPDFDTISAQITYQLLTSNNGCWAPTVYTYNSDGSRADVFESTIGTSGSAGLPLNTTISITRTVILKKSTSRTYRAYIRAWGMSGNSNWKHFRMTISNAANVKGNPSN